MRRKKKNPKPASEAKSTSLDGKAKDVCMVPVDQLRAVCEGEVAGSCFRFGLRGLSWVMGPKPRISVTGPLETTCLGERGTQRAV